MVKLRLLFFICICIFSLQGHTAFVENTKTLKVKRINTSILDIASIPDLLDNEHIEFQPVDQINWPKYPYAPKVKFRIAHTEDAILLHFKVTEQSVRARYGEDNGSVWTDSCVEFFCIPGGDDIYYNIECNCIGTVLVGAGSTRSNRERASAEVLSQIQRWSSLGREPFNEKVGETSWEVALLIPYSVFFKHQLTSLNGKLIRANFYKCGDELQTPHYLSWNSIKEEKPNFHCPAFFGTLQME